ncbi:hypothetical protein AGOR_G00014150 [Albula goreensis]|uniref:G-protein coupled receptors family 1 profile domain-containing protein n=1 Tax=Albula goreensis TaxID=1534307 RepID=A0A8T3EAT4_9TELE|nr:hypothetical protein AGOR_G00014150 [Albula goreensis]
MWRKTLLIFLLSLVVLDVSVQARGNKTRKEKQRKTNITETLRPRSFFGEKIPIATLMPVNWTNKDNSSSFSTSFPPELALKVNGTADYFRGALSTRVIPAIYMVAVVIGIPSNAMILGVIITKAKAFSSAILYFSLALSDLLFLLTLVLKAHYHFNGNHWVFGEAACKAVTACFYGNVYCSIHTLMCISVKRYLAIVHPFTYRSLPKHSCTAWSSLIVWVMFFVAMVPTLLIRQTYRLSLGITTCSDVLPLSEGPYSFLPYYKLTLICVGFFVPFVVTVFSYVSIIRELNKSHSDWMYYIKMSTLVFIIFTICFTPSNVIHFIHYVKLYTSGEEHFFIYYNVTMCLCGLHSCLDPFLFSLMSRSMGSKLYFMTFKGKTFSIST